MDDGEAWPNKPGKRAYLGLGSNLGDREMFLHKAVQLLQQHTEVRITGQSGLYETDPVGYADQDPFLNMAVQVDTTLSAELLFERMMHVEQSLERRREIRFGPRTIDLDLLLFGDLVQDRPDLILPHPRMMERAFVLVPLIEVMRPHDPVQSKGLSRQLERVAGKEGVRLWKKMQ